MRLSILLVLCLFVAAGYSQDSILDKIANKLAQQVKEKIDEDIASKRAVVDNYTTDIFHHHILHGKSCTRDRKHFFIPADVTFKTVSLPATITRAKASETKKPTCNLPADNVRKSAMFSIPTLHIPSTQYTRITPTDQYVVKDDIVDALNMHNEMRKRHNAPPLRLNMKMSEEAQEYATELSKLGFLKKQNILPDGENLAFGCSRDESLSLVDATQMWYKELCNPGYKFGQGTETLNGETAGHFTQLVWKGSKELGIGSHSVTTDNNTCTYVVARYRPPGNYAGLYEMNVKRGSFTNQNCSNLDWMKKQPNEKATGKEESNLIDTFIVELVKGKGRKSLEKDMARIVESIKSVDGLNMLSNTTLTASTRTIENSNNSNGEIVSIEILTPAVNKTNVENSTSFVKNPENSTNTNPANVTSSVVNITNIDCDNANETTKSTNNETVTDVYKGVELSEWGAKQNDSIRSEKRMRSENIYEDKGDEEVLSEKSHLGIPHPHSPQNNNNNSNNNTSTDDSSNRHRNETFPLNFGGSGISNEDDDYDYAKRQHPGVFNNLQKPNGGGGGGGRPNPGHGEGNKNDNPDGNTDPDGDEEPSIFVHHLKHDAHNPNHHEGDEKESENYMHNGHSAKEHDSTHDENNPNHHIGDEAENGNYLHNGHSAKVHDPSHDSSNSNHHKGDEAEKGDYLHNGHSAKEHDSSHDSDNPNHHIGDEAEKGNYLHNGHSAKVHDSSHDSSNSNHHKGDEAEKGDFQHNGHSANVHHDASNPNHHKGDEAEDEKMQHDGHRHNKHNGTKMILHASPSGTVAAVSLPPMHPNDTEDTVSEHVRLSPIEEAMVHAASEGARAASIAYITGAKAGLKEGLKHAQKKKPKPTDLKHYPGDPDDPNNPNNSPHHNAHHELTHCLPVAEAALRAHNIFRRYHDVPDLKLNDEMSKQAEEHARHLARMGHEKQQPKEHCCNGEGLGHHTGGDAIDGHRTDGDGHHNDNGCNCSCGDGEDDECGYGENVAYGCYSEESMELNVVDAVKFWYKEVLKPGYDFDLGSANIGTERFTQVVWKASRELGLGMAKSKNDEEYCTYIVARYAPKGNVISKYKFNVVQGLFNDTFLTPIVIDKMVHDIDACSFEGALICRLHNQEHPCPPPVHQVVHHTEKSCPPICLPPSCPANCTQTPLHAEQHVSQPSHVVDQPATEGFPNIQHVFHIDQSPFSMPPPQPSPVLSVPQDAPAREATLQQATAPREATLQEAPAIGGCSCENNPSNIFDPCTFACNSDYTNIRRNQITTTSFETQMLKAHNFYRQIHDANNLKLDDDLSAEAQKYAEEVAKKGKFENVTTGNNYVKKCLIGKQREPNGYEVTKFWYEEICSPGFDFTTRTIRPSTRRMTQIIWKKAQHMGVGKAYNEVDGQKCMFVVARYSPPQDKKEVDKELSLGKYNADACVRDKRTGRKKLTKDFYWNNEDKDLLELYHKKIKLIMVK